MTTTRRPTHYSAPVTEPFDMLVRLGMQGAIPHEVLSRLLQDAERIAVRAARRIEEEMR